MWSEFKLEKPPFLLSDFRLVEWCGQCSIVHVLLAQRALSAGVLALFLRCHQKAEWDAPPSRSLLQTKSQEKGKIKLCPLLWSWQLVLKSRLLLWGYLKIPGETHMNLWVSGLGPVWTGRMTDLFGFPVWQSTCGEWIHPFLAPLLILGWSGELLMYC